jgi:hypothetical protein
MRRAILTRTARRAVDAVLCVIDRSGWDHSRLESIDLQVLSLLRSEEME